MRTWQHEGTARYDAVVVGGGHNALVAAAYLGRAGRSVLVCERSDQAGGAAVSAYAFDGVDVKLSRYAYLVSLLDDRIVSDLGLRITLAPRAVSSHTVGVGPDGEGLTVHREGALTAASFTRCGLGDKLGRWRQFQDELSELATAVAPTLLEPLVDAATLERRGGELAARLLTEPVGALLAEKLGDDVLEGIAGTDALIGTPASLWDPSLVQNACFLYHVVGNGTGQWHVPVGGMGTVRDQLLAACARHGVEVRVGAEVISVEADGTDAVVALADGTEVAAGHVLVGAAPQVLDRLLGREVREVVPGGQMKLNMVLSRLPRPRSGEDPVTAFAGTLHVDERASELETAQRDAAAGRVPSVLPFETYCHTLSDTSILGDGPRRDGWQTLTLFGLATPAALFDGRNDTLRDELVERYLDALEVHLDEPLRPLLVRDAAGRPCVEAHTPLDLEADLGLPRGNIFHDALEMPVARDVDEVGTWGVSGGDGVPANVVLCGAGTRRGGGVSGLGGFAAAHHVLGDPHR